MPVRVRFVMTWTYTRDMFRGAWFEDKDFETRAQLELHRLFAWSYKSELTTEVISREGRTTVMRITWDVNLDGVRGAWHEPEDHVRLAEHALVKSMPGYGQSLEVEILRHAKWEEALDHGQMLAHANEIGHKLEAGDYPVFVPERHPDWKEADEVFLQDGTWWWCANNIDGPEFLGSSGPSAGPKPERIYTPWDPNYRELRYAKAMKAYDEAVSADA